LAERIKKLPKPELFPTFEPTDGPIGKIIRAVLKKEVGFFDTKPETLAMLFAADRNEHLYGKQGILAQANRGILTVSDRYVLSSLAYQGIECGDELPEFLNSRFPAPELIIFFDIEPETALNRTKKRTSCQTDALPEIYDYLEFQEKVRDKYKSLLGKYIDAGVRVETVDASKDEKEVADQVWSIITQMPIFKA
jgi:dTMP kinase